MRTTLFLLFFCFIHSMVFALDSSPNLLRNGNLELGDITAGTPMRQGGESVWMYAKAKKRLLHLPIPGLEGFWIEGDDASVVKLISNVGPDGSRVLKVTAPGRIIAAPCQFNIVKRGPVTISLDVNSEAGDGILELVLANDRRSASPNSPGAATLDIPRQKGWRRVVLTAYNNGKRLALPRLKVKSGSILFDNLQVENTAKATSFRVRNEEKVDIVIDGVPPKKLAVWDNRSTVNRSATITNHSARFDSEGLVKVFLGPWNMPAQREIGRFRGKELPVGAQKKFIFKTAGLRPDAYVISFRYYDKSGKSQLDGTCEITPDNRLAGVMSNGFLKSRLATRFALFDGTPAAKILGVGNGMLNTTGGWFGGYPLKLFAESRPYAETTAFSNWKSDRIYLASAAGSRVYARGVCVDTNPLPGADFANPARKGFIDIFHPEGRKFILERMRQVGQEFRESAPAIAGYQYSNESPFFNHNNLCPSIYADRSFRDWCRRKYHDDLDKLNAAWHTKYKNWNEVEPPASARYIEAERNKPRPQGGAQFDWLASAVGFSKVVSARMRANPARAMEFLRWRTAASLEIYRAAYDVLKPLVPGAVLGNNLCWPAFRPQQFMPFIRQTDAPMLDISYTSGFPRSLGNPMEMIDSLEMAESTVLGKHSWGIEVYVQPTFPAEFVSLQNWGLLAHGMSNIMVFGYYPYSDHGRVKENKAWEKPNAKPIWAILDHDGTRLPHFYENARSHREIAEFHRKFDCFSLQRAKTPVAFYVSPDTGEFVTYESNNKAWLSFYQRTRNVIAFALRIEGVTLDYVDDESLPNKVGRFRFVIIPASRIITQNAAKRLADFANSGGTVILAGVSGLADENLNSYTNIGGKAWNFLKWHAPEYQTDYANLHLVPKSREKLLLRGINYGKIPGATVLKSDNGKKIGYMRSHGKGRFLIYGTAPDLYSSDPHLPFSIRNYARHLIKTANIPHNGRAEALKPTTDGGLGGGSPVIEVVTREKSKGKRFVFLLNQGGTGDVELELLHVNAPFHLSDALTGKAITRYTHTGQTLKLPMKFTPWKYRILYLKYSSNSQGKQ